MLLIAYDGSPDSDAAIDHITEVVPGAEATVLTVWHPYVQVALAGGGMGMAGYAVDAQAIDEASEAAARTTAEAGAERARSRGMTATSAVRAQLTSDAEAILAAADEAGARTIVLGTRGRTGLRSLLLGSVSHAVLQHADRPVIVIPSNAVAVDRAAHRQHGAKLPGA